VKETTYTPNAPAPVGPYSQAVKVNGFVYTAGQLGIDPETGELAGSDIGSQTAQALANVREILAAAGCGIDDIVKVTLYVTHLRLFHEVNAVYGAFFADEGVTSPPARAIAEVSALPLGAQIEIDAIAAVPNQTQ